jgi:PhnB protein
MTNYLSPYRHFDGTAREAMTFYQSVLGGDLQLMTFGDMGMEGEHADRIMHGALTVRDGLVLMGADGPPGEEFLPGNSCSLALAGGDADELRRWFAGLSQGGEVQVELATQMWGDEYGQCKDKYGVTWMVNIAGESGPA